MNKWKISDFEVFKSEILGLTDEQLSDFQNTSIESAYTELKIRKNKDEYRTIYALQYNTMLRTLQFRLYQKFLREIYLPDYVFGFKENSSYFSYLKYHTTTTAETRFLALDIKDFFENISIKRVKKALQYYIDDECVKEDAQKIIELFMFITTLKNHFVQGAITSPAISNLAFRQIDMRIEAYCIKIGVKYSRYADDLLFSSSSNIVHRYRFESMIKHILKDAGFSINNRKTQKQKGELRLNGYVVGESIHLSRKKLSELSKTLWDMEQKDFSISSSTYSKEGTRHFLAGYRSFLIEANRYCENDKHRKHLDKLIKRSENLMDKFCGQWD